MKENNVVQEKAFALAVRVVNLCRHLQTARNEFVLSKQVLRSGTSIGANIEEALGGQSDKDFYSKINIAYKESRETLYWMRLLTATGILSEAEGRSIMADTEEVALLLGKITKTMKTKLEISN